jgi:hypothetical protein
MRPEYIVFLQQGFSNMRNCFSLRNLSAGLLGVGLLTGSLVGLVRADEPATTKHTIKEAMKAGHKGGLLKKILDGEATQEEKQLMLDFYISMVESKPEKGELSSWHLLAGNGALAAAKVVVGREDGIESLKAATNCKACHDVHK